jgi:hypothetical protein
MQGDPRTPRPRALQTVHAPPGAVAVTCGEVRGRGAGRIAGRGPRVRGSSSSGRASASCGYPRRRPAGLRDGQPTPPTPRASRSPVANDKQGRERLCRYILRLPLAVLAAPGAPFGLPGGQVLLLHLRSTFP